MGIHGLLPFLRKFVKNMNLREPAGQTAAIDASCWLHKGLSVSFAETGSKIGEKYFQVVHHRFDFSF